MRKKKLYVPMLAILTLISTGCEKTPDLYQGNKSGEDLMSNPMQELKIDVPTGKYAVVCLEAIPWRYVLNPLQLWLQILPSLQ